MHQPTAVRFSHTLFLIVALLVLGALPHAAARPMAEDLPTQVITDALGREVTIPRPAERIALGGRAVIMTAGGIYLFPGASERIVGIGDIQQGKGNFFEAIDPAYGEKTIFHRNVGPEQMAAVFPDVAILKSIMRDDLGDGLERLGIPVVYIDLETPEQYERDLRILGRILEDRTRAEELIAFFAERREAVESRVRDIPRAERPRVLLLSYTESAGEPVFSIPPRDWLQTELVRMAGGTPVWVEGNPGRGWQPVSFEQIAAWNPEVVTIVSYRQPVDQVAARTLARPEWQSLGAAQEGRVYAFPGDFYSWDQPDVRWILGLQWLGTRLHPQRFSDLDMDAELREFFSFLFGMSPAQIDSIIVPLLDGDLR